METVLVFRTFGGESVIPYASSRVMQLLVSCSVDQNIWMEDIIPHSLGARTAWTINRCQNLCIKYGDFARTCKYAQKKSGTALGIFGNPLRTGTYKIPIFVMQVVQQNMILRAQGMKHMPQLGDARQEWPGKFA